MGRFRFAFLPSLPLFFQAEKYIQGKKQAWSTLLGQEQPGEMEPSTCLLPACKGVAKTHLTSRPPRGG